MWWVVLIVVVVALVLLVAAIHDYRARSRGHRLRADTGWAVRQRRRDVRNSRATEPFTKDLWKGRTGRD